MTKSWHMVLCTITPTSFHGWGIIALNLMLQWAAKGELALYATRAAPLEQISVDPLEVAILAPLLAGGAAVGSYLTGHEGGSLTLDCPLLDVLGNELASGGPGCDLALTGRPNVGLVVFERPNFSAAALERAAGYDFLLTGSSWNRDVLKARGIGRVECAIQGIDPTLFHPAVRSGLLGDRFVVFSGGKLEPRKGQDLVVRAFRRFARSHPEAVLVTCWGSLWPDFARDFETVPWIEPVPFTEDGQIDQAGWTRLNGIADEQVLHLDLVPNHQMARLMREADIALFPNRAEGGTNMVAMECMACGVPTILSANTGHLDIIRDDACYVLERQSLDSAPERAGWADSDPDEIVEVLERIHADRAAARVRGLQGARFMAGLTWARYAEDVASHLRPTLDDRSLVRNFAGWAADPDQHS